MYRIPTSGIDISIGDISDCNIDQSRELAVLHCCKNPCYKDAIGWAPPSAYVEDYVIHDGNHMVLNIIDPPVKPLFYASIFRAANRFMREHEHADRKILVHCVKGLSRSPSVVLTYLAATQRIASDSYSAARSDFQTLYPVYRPMGGIELFLTQQWASVLAFDPIPARDPESDDEPETN